MRPPAARRARRERHLGRAGRTRHVRLATGVLVAGVALLASACGGAAHARGTVPAPVASAAGGVERVTSGRPPGASEAPAPARESPALSLPAVRARYLAAVAPAEAAFAKLSGELGSLGPAAPGDAVDAEVRPAAAAIARAARRLYELSRSASGVPARDLYAVAVADNAVWQGLEDLASGGSSRSFELSSWEGAFSQALRRANGAAAALRKALGSR